MQSFPLEKEVSCALFADEIPDFFHHWVMIQYHLNPVLEELPFRTTKRDTRTPSATAQDKYQKLKKKKEWKHGDRVQWPQYQMQKIFHEEMKTFLSISICTVRQKTRESRTPSDIQTTAGNSDNFLQEFIKLSPTWSYNLHILIFKHLNPLLHSNSHTPVQHLVFHV